MHILLSLIAMYFQIERNRFAALLRLEFLLSECGDGELTNFNKSVIQKCNLNKCTLANSLLQCTDKIVSSDTQEKHILVLIMQKLV